MEVREHLDQLRRDGELLAEAAERIGFDAPVPPCPEWVVRDVVQHQGGVHRWATANLTRGTAEPMPDAEDQAAYECWPHDDGILIDWFRDGLAHLIETIAAATEETVAFTWLPAPNARAFWARRQAHETAIHRSDVQSAGEPITEWDASFAADGIDEIVRGMAQRSKKIADTQTRRLLLDPTDVDASWLVEIGPAGATVLESGEPDCTVRGPASALFLLVWNRRSPEGLAVTGDSTLLDHWRDNLKSRWA